MMSPRRSRELEDAFRVVTQIRRIVRAINLHSQELSRSIGLTVPQLVLLQAIADSEDERSNATSLRQAMGVNPATMSGLVDRLVRRGYLERHRSERDRRVVELTLTPAGQGALQQAPSPLQDQVLQRLAALPSGERAAILDSLQRIVGLMEAEDIDASPILTPGEAVSSG